MVVMFLAVGGQGVAAASDERSASVHRIGLDLGVASAVGAMGMSYQLAVRPWLRLEGGVGWGPTGVQLSAMPKLAIGGRVCRFAAGLGGSVAVAGTQAAPGHGPDPDAIPWLNLDALGIECRSAAGLSFQAALGLTTPLVDFHYDISELGGTIEAGAVLPQGRVGIGWWF